MLAFLRRKLRPLCTTRTKQSTPNDQRRWQMPSTTAVKRCHLGWFLLLTNSDHGSSPLIGRRQPHPRCIHHGVHLRVDTRSQTNHQLTVTITWPICPCNHHAVFWLTVTHAWPSCNCDTDGYSDGGQCVIFVAR